MKHFCAKNGRGLWYAGPTQPDLGHALWRPHQRSRTELDEETARRLADEHCGAVFEITVTEHLLYTASLVVS